MPAAVAELRLSRRLVYRKSAELLYRVSGTDSEVTAMAALLAAAPSTYDFAAGSLSVSLPQESAELEPVHVDTVGGVGEWQGRVLYRDDAASGGFPPEAGESEYQFDSTGGAEHITTSKALVATLPLNSAECKGAIGFDGQNVQGCDIVAPTFRFSEKHYKSNSFVDAAYKLTVRSLTGTTNNATFKGFAIGEVLFLGCTGARRGRSASDLWELTYQFAVGTNQAAVTVPNISGTIAKGAWNYMWVRYVDDVNGTTPGRVRVPQVAYVERVYDPGDFSTLDIGTT